MAQYCSAKATGHNHMTTTENHIAASCTISNNTVVKNGEPIFADKGVPLHDFLQRIYQHFQIDYPKFHKLDALSKLGWLAAEILLRDFDKAALVPEDIGVVLSNASSSLDTDIKYLETVSDMPSPSLFVYTLPNIVTGEICIRNNFKGENAFFVCDQFDGALLSEYVNGLLHNQAIKVCICGWVDVLEEDYKAALFLVAKGAGATTLTKESMDNIFNAAL